MKLNFSDDLFFCLLSSKLFELLNNGINLEFSAFRFKSKEDRSYSERA